MKVFRQNRLFLVSYFLIFTVGLLFFLLKGHGELVLLVNQHRTTFLDAIMPPLTFVGDGIFFAMVIIGVLLWKWRLGVIYVVAGVSSLILSGFLKRVVFPDRVRPKLFFEEAGVLNFIEGVEVHGKFSFPSGHTISVFAMLTMVSLTFASSRWLTVSIVFFAWIVGFSRIYLLQHFLADVLAGSLVGVIIAFSSFIALGRWARAIDSPQGLQ